MAAAGARNRGGHGGAAARGLGVYRVVGESGGTGLRTGRPPPTHLPHPEERALCAGVPVEYHCGIVGRRACETH